jgi:hypothetical protein
MQLRGRPNPGLDVPAWVTIVFPLLYLPETRLHEAGQCTSSGSYQDHSRVAKTGPFSPFSRLVPRMPAIFLPGLVELLDVYVNGLARSHAFYVTLQCSCGLPYWLRAVASLSCSPLSRCVQHSTVVGLSVTLSDTSA